MARVLRYASGGVVSSSPLAGWFVEIRAAAAHPRQTGDDPQLLKSLHELLRNEPAYLGIVEVINEEGKQVVVYACDENGLGKVYGRSFTLTPEGSVALGTDVADVSEQYMDPPPSQQQPQQQPPEQQQQQPQQLPQAKVAASAGDAPPPPDFQRFFRPRTGPVARAATTARMTRVEPPTARTAEEGEPSLSAPPPPDFQARFRRD